MSKQAFYLQRMNDHVQYLQKIRATLKGTGDFQGMECTQCALGQWAYGEGRDEVLSYGAEMHDLYEDLLEQHKAFHQASSEALSCHQNDDEHGQYRAMTEMHTLSNDLVQRLLKMDAIARNVQKQVA